MKSKFNLKFLFYFKHKGQLLQEMI